MNRKIKADFWVNAKLGLALGVLLLIGSSLNAQADSDAIVQLPLDDGVGTVAGDVSGMGHDGTLVNGAEFEANTGDGSAFAVRFDGLDDRIDVGVVDVNGTGLTLAAWFNADGFPGPSNDPRLISKASGTGANDHVFMLSTIRVGSAIRLRARVRIGGSTTTLIASGGDLVAGVWRHAAVTYDGVTLRLYLDGIEVGSTPLTGAVDMDPSVAVAVGAQPAGAGSRFFDGLIDDVRILQRALGATEVAGIAASGNQPPVAADDVYDTAPETPLVVDAANGVLANDTDPDLDGLQAVLVGDVSHGELNLNADGSFDYTPAAGFGGLDSFTYQANDTQLDSNLATVTITVTTSNPDAIVQLPLDDGVGTIAGDVSGMGNDGTLVNGAAFEANTGDGSAYAVRFDGLDDRIDVGVVDVNGTGLTLAAWFNADSFPGSSSDPRLISKASGTGANDHVFMLSTIRVGSATRLRARVRVGGSTTTLIASGGDLVAGVWRHAAMTYDGVTLRLYLDGIEVGSRTLAGAVDVDPSVAVAVGSQPPGAGPRFFDGLIDDVRILQRALSATEVAAIAASGNQPPVAADDAYETAPDTLLVVDAANGVLANDTDPDLDGLQAVLVGDVSNGVLTLNANGSFDYTPNADFSGLDSFTYHANDAQLDSNLATVTITVNAVNGAPVATDDAYETPPDTLLVVDAANGVLANDTDPDLDGLQAVLVGDVSHGVLTLNADGSFDYTPDTGFGGLDSFTYQANDTQLDSNLATVTITVEGTIVNLPTAVDDEYSVDEDITLSVLTANGVLTNDVDNNPPEDLSASLLTNPTNGTLTSFASDGGFTYVPNANFNGVDSFTYEAVDGGSGATAQGTVTLTINAVNDTPVAQDDAIVVQANAPSTFDIDELLLANDGDIDGDALSLGSFTQPALGTLVDNTDGTLTYTPPLDFVGSDTFSYTSSDGQAQSNSATVTISVGGENSPPRIVTGTIIFTKQIIDVGVDETHSVVAADLDGDGDIDAVATDYVDDSVFWYENDGSGSFVTRVLDTSLAGAYPADVADVDGDGDIDVLATGYLANTVVWYENYSGGAFTRHDVDNAAGGAHSVVTGDMDQDGDVDLLTTNQDADTVTWYENDGNNIFTRHTIDNTANGAKRAEFADIDGDGDLDVISGSFFVDEIAWHENDGNQNFTKLIIDNTANGAYYAFPADIDGDGDLDVLAVSQLDDTIAWYRNDGVGNFTAETIDTNANAPRTVIAADIDGDGDLDAVTASVADDTVAWYKNDGGGNFAKQVIDLAADGAYGVFPIDMDKDGDVDVLSASRDANAVALHLQIKAHVALVEMSGTLVIDTALLRTVDADDSPMELTYTVTNGPDFGELQVDGVSVSEGGSFTQDDVDNGRVTYIHFGVNSVADGFSFTVADGGEGGIKPAAGTFTFNIVDPADTLVELPLDDGTGTIAEDISGMGHDGMLVNGAEFEANTGDGSAFAVRFDGLDDRIDVGVVDVNGTGLTLAAWFNADSFPGSSNDPRLISKASGTGANDHVFMLSTIRVGSAIRLRTRVRIGGSTTTLIASGGDLVAGIWRHAAVTYDGVTLRLYLDGIEVGSTTLTGVVDVDPSVAVAVGSQPPGAGPRFFDGLIDDVRILQRALSATEVAAIAASRN